MPIPKVADVPEWPNIAADLRRERALGQLEAANQWSRELLMVLQDPVQRVAWGGDDLDRQWSDPAWRAQRDYLMGLLEYRPISWLEVH